MTPETAENLLGLNIEPLEESLTTGHPFVLTGKSMAHYLWLGLSLVSSMICVGLCYRVATARGMKGRWLWCLVALIATPTFNLNWTNGDITLGPMSLVGVSIMRVSPWSAWIVGFGFPLGAAIALARLRAWQGATSSRKGERPPSEGQT
jgi:hypothetical protein